MSVENVICPVPWIMSSIRNNGDFRVCCHASLSESKGIIKDDANETMNCKSSTIDETRNSSILKELRSSMLQGKRHQICTRCFREEDNGVSSRRQYELNNAEGFFNVEDVKTRTNLDGSIDIDKFPLTNIDVRFGNKCNLKCRMCGPTDSDAWYKDYVSLWEEEFFDDSHGRVELEFKDGKSWKTVNDDYDWIESDFFWKNIHYNIKDLKYIHTVGGEPLLIDKHYDLLEVCVKMDVAKNIVLEYNTNGTVLPDRALEIWKHFKEVRIGVSVDGFGPVNDYIRYPSQWKVIEKNLERLDKASGKLYVWLSFTVQALNIFYLDEFIKWKLTSRFHSINGFYKKNIISFHPLHSPKFMSVKILPEPIKYIVKNRLEALEPWFEEWVCTQDLKEELKESYRKNLTKIINGYIDFMYSSDDSKYFDMFMHTQDRLDDIRGRSMRELLPEFHSLVSEFRNPDYKFKYLK